MTPADIQAAIKAQNAQVAFGKLGGPCGERSAIYRHHHGPDPALHRGGVQQHPAAGEPGRLQGPAQDVARVELAGENYDATALYNGQATAAVAIKLATGANALDTAEHVRTKLGELSEYFPANMEIVYPYDTTPFVKISIEEVVQTLIEAIFLVFCVMYLFLQNFRPP